MWFTLRQRYGNRSHCPAGASRVVSPACLSVLANILSALDFRLFAPGWANSLPAAQAGDLTAPPARKAGPPPATLTCVAVVDRIFAEREIADAQLTIDSSRDCVASAFYCLSTFIRLDASDSNAGKR